jgi:hypothetical protein
MWKSVWKSVLARAVVSARVSTVYFVILPFYQTLQWNTVANEKSHALLSGVRCLGGEVCKVVQRSRKGRARSCKVVHGHARSCTVMQVRAKVAQRSCKGRARSCKVMHGHASSCKGRAKVVQGRASGAHFEGSVALHVYICVCGRKRSVPTPPHVRPGGPKIPTSSSRCDHLRRTCS